ncbi:phosphotransferase family protein [Devosia soli]|nr:aminoglycoside phosphotransferase family protein [Devosia soli]
MTQLMPRAVIEAIENVVRFATGQGASNAEVIHADEDYWIASIGEPSARLIVKIASSNRVPSFEKAKAKHDFITSTAQVPMARMIAADDGRTRIPFRYSIQTRVLGEEWFTRRSRLDDGDRERALANLGDVVGRLHLPRLSMFGTLPMGQETECLAALLAHCREIIRDQSIRARFTEHLEQNAHLWADVLHPAITHDDLHGFNVLFHPHRPVEVSGILDFDKAWGGPAESDLARMELWRGMSSQSFLAAYRDHVPELAGYGERRPFYQLLWCLEFAQNTQDHLDTTNVLLARLGMPSLKRFS